MRSAKRGGAMTVIMSASFDQTLWYRFPDFCGKIAGFRFRITRTVCNGL